MIRTAKDLSPDQKQAIESLLGQTLSEQDNISLRRLPPSRPLSFERRQEIAEALRSHFAQVDAQRQPISDAEAQDNINEAIRSVKPGYRPIS